MKIAFDVDVLAKQMDINRMVHQVADWGYRYIEQSPHPRINRCGNLILYCGIPLVRSHRGGAQVCGIELETNDRDCS